jgi:hypothetical protein
MGAKTYKSSYQGEGGIYKVSSKTSGQTYKGKKKKETKFLDPYRIVDFIKKAID